MKTLIKDIPEFINIEDKTFKNVPVSGIVIESIDFPNREDFYHFDELIHSFGAKLYDPRGFRIKISYNNLCELIKHTTIVNGVIEEDLLYAVPGKDELESFIPHFWKPKDSVFNWCLVKKDTKVDKTASSDELIPGNRYRIESTSSHWWGRKKKSGGDSIYLGEFNIRNLGYRYTTQLFIDIDTESIIEYPNHGGLWTVIREQDPSDLDLLKVATEKFNNTIYGENSRIVKLIQSPKLPFENFDLSTFIEETKHLEQTRYFIKTGEDGEIYVLKIISRELGDKRMKSNRYEVYGTKYWIDGNKVRNDYIPVYSSYITGDELKKFSSQIGEYKCISLTTCDYRSEKFINCIDSFGNIVNLYDLKSGSRDLINIKL